MSTVRRDESSTQLLVVLAEIIRAKKGPFTFEEIAKEMEKRNGVALKEGEDCFIKGILEHALLILPNFLERVATRTYSVSDENKKIVVSWLLRLAERAKKMRS